MFLFPNNSVMCECMCLCACECVRVHLCVHTFWYQRWILFHALLSDILSRIYIYIYIRGSLNTFPDFFRTGTFIDSTHMKLVPFEVISSGCNAQVVPFQKLLEGPMEVLLCQRVSDLRHSFFQLLNCLITTASELRE